MAIIQSGSGNGATAIVNSNNALEVSLETQTLAGFATLSTEIDAGTIIGTRTTRALQASRDFRLRSGIDTPLFSDYFPGANINTASWTQATTTMTITVASGFLNLNAGASLASAAVARVQTYRFFNKMPTYGIRLEAYMQLSQAYQNNNVIEFGLGLATGTTAPTDGVFMRITAGGVFELVVNNNGSETASASITASAATFSAGVVAHIGLEVTDAYAALYFNDILAATVPRPTSLGTLTAANSLPILIRNYNSGATTLAQILKVGAITVTLMDGNYSKQFPHLAAGNSGMAHQGQTGGTMGTTELAANSSNGTLIAALSNTAVVAAQNTGFGGLFSFAAGATAATDYIVQDFQNPAGTAALPGRNLFITGVKISSVNTGAAVATSCTLLEWTLAVGATAVSLATTDGAGTKSPRKIPIGFQTWPIGAAIGQMPDKGDIYMPFNSPLLINPGEFLVTAVKFYIGTATASQVIVANITFDGYYE